jgi:hypothetical protein
MGVPNHLVSLTTYLSSFGWVSLTTYLSSFGWVSLTTS